jgi:hypothetical protein
MANPVAKAMTFDASVSSDQAGACREFWMRFPGLRGASDQDAGGNDVLYYIENPYSEDLVVLDALCVIETLDAQDGDIDVGLEDDAAGTDSLTTGAIIFDSIVNTAVGVFEGTIPQALAGTGAKYIWKAKGSATQAFLTVTQNGDVDAAALRWTLLVKVIPYKDLLNSSIELGAITVA